MVELLKQRVERAIGDTFVQWYNKNEDSNFEFEKAGDDPPDLVYREGAQLLPIEVTTEYYDSAAARMCWEAARRAPAASDRWSGEDPDQSLAVNITERIRKKCVGTHDPGTILVIGLHSALTTKADFEKLRNEVNIPQTVPFSQIYAGGHFPSSSDSPGGYFYFKLR